jgi:hypothetical protein
LGTTLLEWRQRDFSSLQIGTSKSMAVEVPGTSNATSTTVTRIGPELFWIVAEATAADGSRSRENLIVRVAVPRGDSLPAMLVAGDALLSRRLSVIRDSTPGCASAGPDLAIGAAASLTSVDGALPSVSVARRSPSPDSSALADFGGLSLNALAASADIVLPVGATIPSPSGLVHAAGDLTVTGGAGRGVLIVDGRLTLTGPGSFVGLVLARGGVTTGGDGFELTGSIRAGTAGAGGTAMQLVHQFVLRPSPCSTQDVVRSVLRPQPVAGRSWMEVY